MNLFKRLVKFFKNKKPNYSHECGNTYTVRSQNGLNNAIYDSIGCFENGENTLTKKELREAVESDPTRYP